MSEVTDPMSLKQRLLNLGIPDAEVDAVCAYLSLTYGATDAADVITLNLTADQWETAGLKKAKANRAVTEFAPPKAVEPTPAPTAPTTSVMVASLLTEPPDGEDYLKKLVVGGELKVSFDDAIALARIGVADTLVNNIGSIVEDLESRINARSVALGRINPAIYYELRRLVDRRRHAEILRVLDVPAARVFTEREQKELRGRLQSDLWPKARNFHGEVEAWNQAYQALFTPNMLLGSIAAVAGHAPAMGVTMTVPPFDGVLDAARALADAYNRVFAGNGLIVARAMAADASGSLDFLDKDELLSAVGVADREELIRTLGITVDASAARAQKNVAKYLFNALKVGDQGEDMLPQYVTQLLSIGTALPWGQLGVGENGLAGKGRPPTGLDRDRARP